MFSKTTEEMIDEAIIAIETEWIEYQNGNKTAGEAWEIQRFILRELIEEAQ